MIRILEKKIFIKSKKYIQSNARDLDKELFEFEFENKSEKTIFEALKLYQNDDGGFGHALEPDIRMSESSVIATTIAFQYLEQMVKTDLPEDMVKNGIAYLLKNKQSYPKNFPLKYFWYPVPPKADLKDHAPWWNNDNLQPPSMEQWPNPSIEVIGYLLKFSKYVSQELIEELLNDLQTYFKSISKLESNSFYSFKCFKRLINYLPKYLQEKVFELWNNSFSNSQVISESNLKEVKIQNLVTEKTSFFYKKFPHEVEKLLKKEISNLAKDGGSHPAWKWGIDQVWTKVEKEWAGKLTVELLITLKYCNFLSLDT